MTSEQYKILFDRKQAQIRKAKINAILLKACWNVIPPQPEKRKGCVLMLLLLIFIITLSYIFLKN